MIDPAAEPGRGEGRAPGRPTEQVREGERQQVVWSDRVFQRARRRQRRPHARSAEREYRNQLDCCDAETARQRASDTTGARPGTSAQASAGPRRRPCRQRPRSTPVADDLRTRSRRAAPRTRPARAHDHRSLTRSTPRNINGSQAAAATQGRMNQMEHGEAAERVTPRPHASRRVVSATAATTTRRLPAQRARCAPGSTTDRRSPDRTSRKQR